MPNNLTDSEENRLLDLSLIDGDHLALMTTLPTDAAGGTEVVGGGYARQSVVWDPASGGSKSNDVTVTFINLEEVEVMAWEVWSSDDTIRKWYGLWAPKTGTADAGTDSITLGVSHGYVDDEPVVFQAGEAPAGITPGDKYYVISADSTSIQVSETLSGSAVDITSDSSSVTVGKIVSVPNAGNATVPPNGIVCSLS